MDYRFSLTCGMYLPLVNLSMNIYTQRLSDIQIFFFPPGYISLQPITFEVLFRSLLQEVKELDRVLVTTLLVNSTFSPFFV